MARRIKQPTPLLSVSGSIIAHAHTVLGLGAFVSALAIGSWLHYHKIVKNAVRRLFVGFDVVCSLFTAQWYGYPEEWFPSVSATMYALQFPQTCVVCGLLITLQNRGDWYPERNLFQILIALTSGPRLGLILLSYLLNRNSTSSVPGFIAICGFLRTIFCGGWVFVTSSDDHDFHDVAMISYLVLTIPWQLGTLLTVAPACQAGNPRRKLFSGLFFGSLIPLVYYFIQHKVHRVAGAYTIYAFWEWSLIAYDLLYDSCFAIDFSRLNITISDVGPEQSAPYVSDSLFGQTSEVSGVGRSTKAEEKQDAQVKAVAKPAPVTFVHVGWRNDLEFIVDSVIAFTYWSTLTVLGPVIFYFSVWSMGLDGLEVLLFCTLSPAILVIPQIRRFLTTNLPVLHIVSLAGMASYVIDRELFFDDAVDRLHAVSFAVATSTLAWTLEFSHAYTTSGKEALEKKVASLSVGLVASLLVKYAGKSINPVWPIVRANNGGWNKTGLGVGLVACLATFLRPRALTTSVTSSTNKAKVESSPVVSGLSLGALWFLIHTLYTDSGTIIAWSWSGYPVNGPTPVPHGALTILAMASGILLQTNSPRVTSNPWWSALGTFGLATLYAVPDWPGFIGGCIFGAYATSQFPVLIQSACDHNIGITFGIAFLLYDLMELAGTFTVAYAFVPGGNMFREKTGIVIAINMAFIVVAALYNQPKSISSSSSSISVGKRWKYSCAGLLATLSLLAFLVASVRKPQHAPVPYNPEDKAFRAGIWTVHFGVDSGMWESQRRMRDVIQELELDIVGLLESDLQRIVLGNRDLSVGSTVFFVALVTYRVNRTQFIAEDLGMYVDLGPGPNKHTWGAALLSKFPIIKSTHHLLPSPRGELAPAIHATLDVFGTLVDVVVCHNGQEEDAIDRELQSRELARIMAEAYPRPLIFLGYVVTKPHADRPAPYKYLIEDGKMLDIEPADWDRWCEYILFRGLKRTAYARVNRGSYPAITDTEIQLGAFQIPDEPVSPDADPSMYWTKKEEQVPARLRLPPQFKGNGTRGHYYLGLAEQFEGIEDVVYYV